MKKLMALVLVLGMASLASAAMTLQISVAGDQDPAESEYTLLPSETIELDIWTTADITPGVGEGYWALTCQVADASISGGRVHPDWAAEPGIVIYDDAVGVGGIPLPQGENGVWGGIALTGIVTLIPAGSTVYDQIVFHCEWAPNDVVISLWETDFVSEPILLDQVIIHQIPEPMTITLLGLGGLALLRRRK